MNLDFEQQIVTAVREIYIQGEGPLPLALVNKFFYVVLKNRRLLYSFFSNS